MTLYGHDALWDGNACLAGADAVCTSGQGEARDRDRSQARSTGEEHRRGGRAGDRATGGRLITAAASSGARRSPSPRSSHLALHKSSLRHGRAPHASAPPAAATTTAASTPPAAITPSAARPPSRARKRISPAPSASTPSTGLRPKKSPRSHCSARASPPCAPPSARRARGPTAPHP